jgi:hypothetical protein
LGYSSGSLVLLSTAEIETGNYKVIKQNITTLVDIFGGIWEKTPQSSKAGVYFFLGGVGYMYGITSGVILNLSSPVYTPP